MLKFFLFFSAINHEKIKFHPYDFYFYFDFYFDSKLNPYESINNTSKSINGGWQETIRTNFFFHKNFIKKIALN